MNATHGRPPFGCSISRALFVEVGLGPQRERRRRVSLLMISYFVELASTRMNPPERLSVGSFNGKLRDECSDRGWFRDLNEARAVIDKLRRFASPRHKSLFLMRKHRS
jgi:hypothetical protein